MTTVRNSRKVLFGIQQKLISAASRNRYDSLKKKKEWNSTELIELEEEATVFEGKYMERVAYYVFLKDGKIVELGRKKYEGPVEAAQSLVKRAKKENKDKPVDPATNFTIKRFSDGVAFANIISNVVIPEKRREIKIVSTPETKDLRNQ